MEKQSTAVGSPLLEEIEALLKEVAQDVVLPEIMNIKQAARFLHLSRSTIYTKVCRKQIPYFKKAQKLYFQKSKLTSWLLGETPLNQKT